MTDLVIKGVDEKFVEMVKNIYRSKQMRIKGGIQINLSGDPDDYNFFYTNIHPDNATKIVKFENLSESLNENKS